ncbi:T9SS type A sorting domain-containing protein [Aquimarina agarivorans]|uniref:T9SS type A sorting domain-containing protein n=1 Tax=Aquimarina agarivorans TaxID=980584 RepID=UPI000248EBCE|nr:T9SS type A sorting domain-containing protein [Aquimarina agarivorans]
MKLISFITTLKYYSFVGTLILVLASSQLFAQQIGDPGWEFDSSKYDNKYPNMRVWAEAGVQGGIPYRNDYKNIAEIRPGADIQKAIDNMANRSGGGVVLLKNGTYNLGTKRFRLKSNVRLRGESKNGVKLISELRETNNKREKILFTFNGVEKAGLEDLSVELAIPSGVTINDDRNNPKNKFCNTCWKNNPSGRKDLYIQFIDISKNSKNSWIDNCVFKNSGTSPIEVNGKNITCRNNIFDTAANKGGGGEGYYLIQGQNGLYYNETVKRLRHFTLQHAAHFNVVIKCNLEVDVNFHNGDRGSNLIEQNKITSLRWRSWHAFSTGGARYGHKKPGPNNIIYNNDATNRDGKKGASGAAKIYTYKGYGDPSVLSNTKPSGGTFYAVKRKNNAGTPPKEPVVVSPPISKPTPAPSPTPKPIQSGNKKPQVSFKGISNGANFKEGVDLDIEVTATDADGNIANVKLYINNKFVRQENVAPYKWEANKGKDLANIKKGTYVLRAVATDNRDETTTREITISVGSIPSLNTIPVGKTIWLKANQGKGDYVVAERNADRVPVRANRKRVGTWEEFLVEDAGNGKVFLKARAANQYVQARLNEQSQLLASINNKRGWETFTWESKGNGKVALKAFNNKYVSAKINTADKALIANANEARGWETFNWGVVSGAKQLENNANVKITAYPNPTVDSIILESEELTALASINVCDSNGVVLETIPLVNELDKIVVDLTSYSQGVYMLTLLSLESKAKVIKVIKE